MESENPRVDELRADNRLGAGADRSEESGTSSELKAGLVDALDAFADYLGQVPLSQEVRDELRARWTRLEEAAWALQLQDLEPVEEKAAGWVDSLSRQVSTPVRFVAKGFDTVRLEPTLLETLELALVHAIRNSFAHGLQSANARVEAGKPPAMTIRASLTWVSGSLLLSVSDDGAGENSEALRPSRPQDQVAGLSGRRVGLDAIREAAQNQGGHVSIESKPGVGFELQFALNPRLFATKAGEVLRGEGRFLFPEGSLARIAESEKTDREAIYDLGKVGGLSDASPEQGPVLVRLTQSFGRSSVVRADQLQLLGWTVFRRLGKAWRVLGSPWVSRWISECQRSGLSSMQVYYGTVRVGLAVQEDTGMPTPIGVWLGGFEIPKTLKLN